jgi:hypothetical protein
MAEDQNREELANFAKQVDSDLNPPAAVENAADPATSSPAAPAASPLAAELKMFASGILNMVFPAFPSLRGIYTEPVIDGLCNSGAAVCDKRGWLQNGIGGEYAEEIAFVLMAIPLGLATNAAVRHDIAVLKAMQQNPDGTGMADTEKAQQAAA